MILGIDYGLRNIGLAISEGEIAQPLVALTVRGQKSITEKIREAVKKLSLALIVVGVSEGKSKNQAIAFGKKIGTVLRLPVAYEDETLSSFEAGPKNHAKAAAIILQRYLDNH